MRIYNGDCLDILPTLESDSVDSIVTDPPYELGFMGKTVNVIEWIGKRIANEKVEKCDHL